MKVVQGLRQSLFLAPLTAGATTVRTANVDVTGAHYATIAITLGAELNTNSTNVNVRLLESDSTVATTFATFNATFNRNLDNTNAILALAHVDLKARRKFLRLELTPDTTTNGPVVSSAVVLLDLARKNSSNALNADVVMVG
jgi:hypothetical protein